MKNKISWRISLVLSLILNLLPFVQWYFIVMKKCNRLEIAKSKYPISYILRTFFVDVQINDILRPTFFLSIELSIGLDSIMPIYNHCLLIVIKYIKFYLPRSQSEPAGYKYLYSIYDIKSNSHYIHSANWIYLYICI